MGGRDVETYSYMRTTGIKVRRDTHLKASAELYVNQSSGSTAKKERERQKEKEKKNLS